MIETQKRNVLIFSLKNIEDLWTMFFEMGIFGIVTSERRAYVNAHFVYNDPRKENANTRRYEYVSTAIFKNNTPGRIFKKIVHARF